MHDHIPTKSHSRYRHLTFTSASGSPGILASRQDKQYGMKGWTGSTLAIPVAMLVIVSNAGVDDADGRRSLARGAYLVYLGWEVRNSFAFLSYGRTGVVPWTSAYMGRCSCVSTPAARGALEKLASWHASLQHQNPFRGRINTVTHWP